MKIYIFFFFLYFIACPTTFAQLSFLQDDFYNQEVVEEGLLHPVGIAFDDEGTGYIWEKRGVLRILDTSGTLMSGVLIDISEEVVGNNDHGLLGFALDPDYLNNGFIYLFYTVDRHHLLYFGTDSYDPKKTIENQATIARIARYQVDRGTPLISIVPDSRKILVGKDLTEKNFPVLMASHGVGSLVFGEDGTLLASFGDAAGFQRRDIGSAEETYFEQALADGIISPKENIGSFKAQLADNLAGKIIRIDPATGDGLPGNPFFEGQAPRAAKSRVWAMGLRNPYRIIHKPGTGDHDPGASNPGTFIIGDVGAGSWEEISILDKQGVNFGWPFYEGYKYAWQFWGQKVLNQDTENPLFSDNLCDRKHFYFEELFHEENQAQLYHYPNPCNPEITIPNTINTHVHRRPALAFSNASWNPPARAYLGTFDDSGKASATSVSEFSEVEANDFDGYSIIPGCFYQGNTFPETYRNNLFVADFSGWIKTVTLDEANRITSVKDFMQREKGIVGLTHNLKDDCLYYIQYNTHSVNKICFGGNPPPVARIEVDKHYGPSPLTVQLDAGNSQDPFGENLTYHWDFGNGQTSQSAQVEMVFSASDHLPAVQTVQLIVTDEAGKTDQAEQLISLNNTPPDVRITSFSDGDQYPISNTSFLPLAANVTDPEHSDKELFYTWQVFLHHKVHFHPEPEIHDRIGQTLISPLGCQTEPYWYRIRLTVKDPAGLEGYDEKEIFPYCGTPVITDFTLNGKAADEGNRLNWDFIPYKDDLSRVELYRGESLSALRLIQTFNDMNVREFIDDSPILGQNYYQLKIIALDGIYDFSNFISLEFPPDPLIQLFPNPSYGHFVQLSLRETFSEKIQFKLMNGLGQIIADYQLTGTEQTPFLQTIGLPQLPNGIYFYTVQNGTLSYGGKLVVGK